MFKESKMGHLPFPLGAQNNFVIMEFKYGGILGLVSYDFRFPNINFLYFICFIISFMIEGMISNLRIPLNIQISQFQPYLLTASLQVYIIGSSSSGCTMSLFIQCDT